MSPRPIVHGTDAGYRAEIRAGLPTCDACRAAHAEANRVWDAATRRRRTGRRPGRPAGSSFRRDEVLAAWEDLRDVVGFREFAPRVGMTYAAWERMFLRARQAGDPRAVRSSRESWAVA